MNKLQWRFPGNNYTQESGIDTPDMETFAKTPLESLAREICQNSIDARINDKTAKVEFSEFELSNGSIPGYTNLLKQMNACIEYQKDNSNISKKLNTMLKALKKEKVLCLRISDNNTTGLGGVKKTEKSPFFILTKGSGISDKNGSTGGSKGIGKFASFVASSFNTVFYSTKNIDGECGSIGICKLCSARMENSTMKTAGIGYYGIDDMNMPNNEQISLDSAYNRTEPGTDIFILGFREGKNWKKDVITKILDSFIVAIQYGFLEVVVGDVEINKETLVSIIENEEYVSRAGKNYASIKSQYILLTDDSVIRKTVSVDDYGEAELFLKSFSKEQQELSTGKCIMVRYPYMKIKNKPITSSIPCAAMCVIGQNELMEQLRSIENPQHTDWCLGAVDDKSLQTEIKNIISKLNNEIDDFVASNLAKSNSDVSDMEGAGQFLPGEEDGISTNDNEYTLVENPVVLKPVKNKNRDKIGVIDNDEGLSLNPDIGNHTDDGDESPLPDGTNNSGGNLPHDSDSLSNIDDDGDNEVLNLEQLIGIRFKYFVSNKETGEYVLNFVSPYSENKCDIELLYLDDNNNGYKADIIRAELDNDELHIENGSIVDLKIEANKRYKIILHTNLTKLYGSEVKIYAHR